MTAASHPDLEPDEIATLNVSSVVDAIGRHDGVSGASVRSGDVAVVGAIFDLATGRVRDVGSRVPSFSTPHHEEAS